MFDRAEPAGLELASVRRGMGASCRDFIVRSGPRADIRVSPFGPAEACFGSRWARPGLTPAGGATSYFDQPR